MNKEQVFELMKFLRNVYSNFDFDQDKLNTWHFLLKDQDNQLVMNKAQQYAKENRFAPAISDIREPEKQKDIRDKEFDFQRWIAEGNDPRDYNWME